MPRKKPHQSLSNELIELVAARFKVLGEPIRLRMLQTLNAEGEMSVSSLAGQIGTTQPNISKHLRILQDAGFVGRRQEGNTVYCYVADPGVFELCDLVCGGLEQRLLEQSRIVGRRR